MMRNPHNGNSDSQWEINVWNLFKKKKFLLTSTRRSVRFRSLYTSADEILTKYSKIDPNNYSINACSANVDIDVDLTCFLVSATMMFAVELYRMQKIITLKIYETPFIFKRDYINSAVRICNIMFKNVLFSFCHRNIVWS